MARTTPHITVIIPVYDDYRRLGRCLAALDEQTYPEDRYDVIVVDNGTPEDRVVDVASRYANVSAIREEKPGSYAARNAGIEAARARTPASEIIAFTDADCIPASTWLERGAAALSRDPNCGLVGGRIILFARNQDRMTHAETWEMLEGFPQQKYVDQLDFAATANVFTRLDVLDQVGGFDPDFHSGGDREFGERVAAAGFELAYADDVCVRHPARRSMSALLRKTVRTTRGDYKRMNKHGQWTPGRGALRLAEACGYLATPLPRALWAFAASKGDPATRCKFALTSALVRTTKEWELARLLVSAVVRGTLRRSGTH